MKNILLSLTLAVLFPLFCSAQETHMDSASSFPFLAYDLAAAKTNFIIKLTAPYVNGGRDMSLPPVLRAEMEKLFSDVFSYWLGAARLAQKKSKDKKIFYKMPLPDVTLQFCERECRNPDVIFSLDLVELDTFLGETVAFRGGYAGQVNGQKVLVIAYPCELFFCRSMQGEAAKPWCAVWNYRSAQEQAEGGNLRDTVSDRLFYLAGHEMGHVFGLSHCGGIMTSYTIIPACVRPSAADGGKLLSLIHFYRRKIEISLMEAAFKETLSSLPLVLVQD